MEETQRTYIPAAGRDWRLPFYDPFTKLIGADNARRTLVERAGIQPGQTALEIGCGTGALLMLLKQRHPDLDVVGLDPDPKALSRARRKAERAGVSIRLDRGFSDALPYPDASFDHVFSSFMFHHLSGEEEKIKTLREIVRALKPGGALHLVDIGGKQSVNPVARWIHSRHLLKDNAEDRVLDFMHQAGLADPKSVGYGAMFFGRVTCVFYQASVPAQ